ncbi:MAG: hypothetical protein H3C62_08400 [Gemmatimonadaceae bacterium]|nr:hypothetical protein [Gemmatimonadaceae bacterium]
MESSPRPIPSAPRRARTSGESTALPGPRLARSSGETGAYALPEELAQRRFARQRQQAVTVIVALALPIAAFGINDVLFAQGDLQRIALMLLARAFTLGAMGWLGYRLARADSPTRFERTLFLAMIGAVILGVFTHFNRPRDSTVVSRFELLSVVGYYIALPMRAWLSAVPAIAMSLASVSMALWWHKNLSAPDLISLIICFALANVLGFLIGRQREEAEQEEELAWRALTSVNANLRKTVAELRALRAVVPVCPSCRKVRGSNEGWQQLEAYVAAREDITFSPILCPDCLQREFGAVLPNDELIG